MSFHRSEGSILTFGALSKWGIFITSLLALFAFSWPLYIPESVFGYEITQRNYWIFYFLVPLALFFLALEINRGAIDIKAIALLGVLAAIAAALRQIGAGAVGIEPIWFIIILAARVFGATFGFALGAMAVALSAILTGGIGPWLPFQIIAASWIGLLAGSLPRNIRGRTEIFALMIIAVISGMGFGFFMDLQLWPWLTGADTQISFVAGDAVSENFKRFITFHFLTAMAWDIPRSLLTATLILITGRPILNALERSKRKAVITSELSAAEKAA
jgi:energy-coupling factor transport system substrate-specific component